ncbi:MAG: gliding motility lipoprotein GldH [Bacteroidetes bacterium]|nr:gliding motility lipoprotein GldH [Bacteroidota bacterium]MBX7127924.1 gliding motility lipoprotein GldH [Flavobacteriales bacterium]MCC6655424.1 gliding motility lipoprotein GldH [Flavobacteriales bacterium]HMU12764.1 gliding motility lipoprotein GldH [Flavobacteriales bacterium]HMW96517.1 gliding motility lipoprotein GldH [Flavobacteriales bacterium]
MKYPIVPVLLCLLLATGCTDGVVFQEDARTPHGAWERGWDPSFSFDMRDTTNPHDVYLDLRHTGDYPFSNLYAFVTLTGPDSVPVTDTVECLLADPTGRWYGSGTGFIRSHRQAHVLYKLRNKFPRSGRYTITLRQAMRTEKLDGVTDVGVSVERSKGG